MPNDAADRDATERQHQANAIRLIRLAGEHERAQLARDFATLIEIDRAISRLVELLPEEYAPDILIRNGRNIIRRARGLDEIGL
jgi:hypothetical protein